MWTTTPWTLPSNMAACVNSELVYARFRQLSTNRIYIMLESRIETIFSPDDYLIIKTFPGKQLKGSRYEPVFEYFSYLKPNAFVVLVDDYVTAESGKFDWFWLFSLTILKLAITTQDNNWCCMYKISYNISNPDSEQADVCN